MWAVRILMINPGNDLAFIRLAEGLVADGIASAPELELRLREAAPRRLSVRGRSKARREPGMSIGTGIGPPMGWLEGSCVHGSVHRCDDQALMGAANDPGRSRVDRGQ